jgi:dynein intermediate chain
MGTQTEDDDFPEPPEIEQDEDDAVEEREKQAGAGEDVGEVPVQQTPEEKDPKLLSAEELEKQVTSAPFSSFINTASKKVERLLGTPMLSELLVDYVGETDGVQRSDNKDSDGSRFLSSRQVYECSKWTSGRDVTDMDWSPLHREFILSTYHMPSSASASSPLSKGSAAVSAVAPNDTLSSSLTPRSGELQSDGLALVWSLSMPTRPEHIFTCGSPVTSGRFHPTESTLVIGGCESGQLVVWDVRAGRLPVQKSALTTVAGASSKGHMHPICSMEIIEGNVSILFYGPRVDVTAEDALF